MPDTIRRWSSASPASGGSKRAGRSSVCSNSRRYAQATEQLDPGDVIVAFSDGVSEAFNIAGEDFGDARCSTSPAPHQALSSQALVDRIVAAVRAFTKGAAQSDDITVMVIRYLGTAA